MSFDFPNNTQQHKKPNHLEPVHQTIFFRELMTLILAA